MYRDRAPREYRDKSSGKIPDLFRLEKRRKEKGRRRSVGFIFHVIAALPDGKLITFT